MLSTYIIKIEGERLWKINMNFLLLEEIEIKKTF